MTLRFTRNGLRTWNENDLSVLEAEDDEIIVSIHKKSDGDDPSNGTTARLDCGEFLRLAAAVKAANEA